ncbi:MAG: hypothetical protein GY898_17350 [Proteobacteria bacterium]|nr:hypothetical protein [Pseudomonadota bacterium]
MAESERHAALDFAAKIKAAAARKEAEEAQQEAKTSARHERVGEALVRLFDDLEAMGDAAGVLGVVRSDNSIALTLDGRQIRIVSDPDDDQPDRLSIDATGVDLAMGGYFGDEIDRWAMTIEYPPEGRRKAYTQVYALLGMGMGWLVEHGLELKLD